MQLIDKIRYMEDRIELKEINLSGNYRVWEFKLNNEKYLEIGFPNNFIGYRINKDDTTIEFGLITDEIYNPSINEELNYCIKTLKRFNLYVRKIPIEEVIQDYYHNVRSFKPIKEGHCKQCNESPKFFNTINKHYCKRCLQFIKVLEKPENRKYLKKNHVFSTKYVGLK